MQPSFRHFCAALLDGRALSFLLIHIDSLVCTYVDTLAISLFLQPSGQPLSTVLIAVVQYNLTALHSFLFSHNDNRYRRRLCSSTFAQPSCGAMLKAFGCTHLGSVLVQPS